MEGGIHMVKRIVHLCIRVSFASAHYSLFVRVGVQLKIKLENVWETVYYDQLLDKKDEISVFRS